MRRVVTGDDVARLLRAAERMARLAQDIGERAQRGNASPRIADVPAQDQPSHPDERLVQASHNTIAAHLRQPDFGAPAMFRSPAWLLMLELFVADRTGVCVSVKAACLTLGGAASTAARTILDLECLGLIASVSDEKDARRRLLKLTASAEVALLKYLNERVEHMEPALRLSVKLSKDGSNSEDKGGSREVAPLSVATVIEPESTLQ